MILSVGAVYDRSRLAISISGEIPLLVRRGGRDIKKMTRSLLIGADGVVTQETTSTSDHPVCAAAEASRFFLSGAATPPHEEGNLAH